MTTTAPSPTVSVETVADLLGVSTFAAYRQAREEGHIGGIPVLRIGRRMVVPRIPLERALQGLPPVPPETLNHAPQPRPRPVNVTDLTNALRAIQPKTSPTPAVGDTAPEPPAVPHPTVAPADDLDTDPPVDVAELGSGAAPTT